MKRTYLEGVVGSSRGRVWPPGPRDHDTGPLMTKGSDLE